MKTENEIRDYLNKLKDTPAGEHQKIWCLEWVLTPTPQEVAVDQFFHDLANQIQKEGKPAPQVEVCECGHSLMQHTSSNSNGCEHCPCTMFTPTKSFSQGAKDMMDAKIKLVDKKLTDPVCESCQYNWKNMRGMAPSGWCYMFINKVLCIKRSEN